ncbi:MAG: class I SAM-dependent methyltransferase [Gillisia sp.]
MHLLLAYIKFLFRSTNQHGVHSPFVYNLLTQCLYKKEKRPAFTTISEYIKAIKQDNRVINVKDFGAGSRVFKSNARKVSDIAKNAGISQKWAFLLNKLTSYFEIRTALELGTSVGISSAAIASGNPVNLTTLEGCPETAAVAREYFKRFELENIFLEVGSFEELLSPQPPKGEQNIEIQNSKFKVPITVESEKWKAESGIRTNPNNLQHTTYNRQPTTDNLPTAGRPTTYNQPQTTNHKSQTNPNNLQHTTYNLKPITDNPQLTTDNPQPTTHNPLLIYFDGNHQKEATLKYFEMLLPLAHNDSVFIFDDIHWSKGMEEAWEEIKAHPRVQVTIDSFFWGIVFFRQEQEKEHFTIRL